MKVIFAYQAESNYHLCPHFSSWIWPLLAWHKLVWVYSTSMIQNVKVGTPIASRILWFQRQVALPDWDFLKGRRMTWFDSTNIGIMSLPDYAHLPESAKSSILLTVSDISSSHYIVIIKYHSSVHKFCWSQKAIHSKWNNSDVVHSFILIDGELRFWNSVLITGILPGYVCVLPDVVSVSLSLVWPWLYYKHVYFAKPI